MGKAAAVGELTEKQALFVKEYRIDGNGRRSAIAAGYSPASAHVTASRTLKMAKVQAALAADQEAQAERLAEYDINSDRVLKELAIVGFGVMGSFYDKDTGRLLEVHEMDEVSQRKLASVKLTRQRTTSTTDGVSEISVEESTVELKQWDKLGALDKMARALGMYVERMAVSADVSLLAVTREIEAREKAAREAAVDAEPVDA